MVEKIPLLLGISIHVLREEDDPVYRSRCSEGRDFYPRPPRGGRPVFPRRDLRKANISIHVLREEDDASDAEDAKTAADFYPRPPRGGRPMENGIRTGHFDFYPRPPRGGRLLSSMSEACSCTFLSTSSARRTTFRDALTLPRIYISIHVLREEDDHAQGITGTGFIIFLSTYWDILEESKRS